MSVLTLAGQPINWDNPPPATDLVRWSERTIYGGIVKGSLRTIAHLDHLNTLALKKFNTAIRVLQSAYNDGVPASAGTHDYDACLDVFIPGVPWLTQQSFFRANGAGAYARVKPGWATEHIHYFTLPPRAVGDVSKRYRDRGFKVGKFVDGGWSLFGRVVGSSQIADYYAHRDALAGHAPDPTWFPPDIDATIFDLSAYAARHRTKVLAVNLINIPDKVGLANIHECFTLAATKGHPGIIGINESFHADQRRVYKQLAEQHDLAYYGLHITPNVVFWKRNDFRRKSGRVYRIHGRNTTAKNAAKYPGFYDKREITEVVLIQKKGGPEVAVLLTHLLYPAKVLNQQWVRKNVRKSKKMLRDLVRTHRDAGRIVVVMGDLNTHENFSMPRGFKWFTKGIIDHIGANRNGSAATFFAPTDHKHGVRSRITQ